MIRKKSYKLKQFENYTEKSKITSVFNWKSTPREKSTNDRLVSIRATYGVVKYVAMSK